MPEHEKVILRFLDGKMLKGFIRELRLEGDHLYIEDETNHQHKVRIKELKAIFFVRRFEGDRTYQERKTFAGTRPNSRRVYVQFRDGENMMGFIEGEIPWERGFFLESMKEKAFTLIPVDEDSNNIKILIFTTAVKDVALIGI
jgi:hypothetical protein